MPRRIVPFVAGCYYHLYNRGNNRQAIFFEQANYLYFLQDIKRYLLPVADIVAYCLMPTHYHTLLCAKQTSGVLEAPEVSSAMMKLSVSYTKAINKRFGRVGVLFQGAFRSIPVIDSGYLLQLCRYIHANPVKDGLVPKPEDWPFSDYLEWIGERRGNFIDHAFIQANFASPEEYRTFVSDYLSNRRLPSKVRDHFDELEAW